jgi:hypothetical protein
MHRYVYAYRLEVREDEVFVKFCKLPDIISAIPKNCFDIMSANDIEKSALDAVLTCLQTYVSTRKEIPSGDNPNLIKADGFVNLSVQQAMKLELFRLYNENCSSILDFARKLDKKETSARRLLDLRHHSWATEIEAAIEAFGKQLVHKWDIELAPKR